ncbi:PilZ domain-containing protein [Bradyrhizobium sp. U87765 SZCCT0131]|nr:PilZ domain-containing protein [Bradyrhizobium sp. U87765 SZCCT0131]MBR1263016.1 PilZ domain-containing protein [Bradyrhizobium sp. U87765 SZCCT0134]MBR1307101.1 PilZ domain-containing protein [Bradyrhizobium sp. U87765 SZCCT0110]MBR1323011.1 PilZ domain-containing protein [Bradyrhizobium sp. U87765 SZCCT0109]MBR1346055.1 PilZ domain-containing protein [Bradyrhizobium sp. U87765 SZCCT0048]
MFGRKQRAPRRRIDREGWITMPGDFAARRCIVIDISDSGAKLQIDDPRFTRTQFELRLSRTDPGRRCRVTWRRGTQIGVAFL